MKEKENSVSSNFFDIIVYSMMIVAVVYVIVETIIGNNGALHFKLVLGIWIIATVIINDFVEPYVLGTFDKMKEYKIQVYVMYAIADAAAFASLFIFIININLYKEPLHYVFLGISIIMFFLKTLFYRKYKHTYSGAEEIADILEDDRQDDVFEDEDDMKVMIYRNRKSNK